MAPEAERGMSAPPEVVFNTATDPDRRHTWLPADVRVEPAEVGEETFEARLTSQGDGPAGMLRVDPGAAGGSSVRLRVDDGPASASAQEMLDSLEREVSDNFNSG
jgi:hypothetical protein